MANIPQFVFDPLRQFLIVLLTELFKFFHVLLVLLDMVATKLKNTINSLGDGNDILNDNIIETECWADALDPAEAHPFTALSESIQDNGHSDNRMIVTADPVDLLTETVQLSWLNCETLHRLANCLDARELVEYCIENPQYQFQCRWLTDLRAQKIYQFSKHMPEQMILRVDIPPIPREVTMNRDMMGQWCFADYSTADIPHNYSVFVNRFGYQVQSVSIDYRECCIGNFQKRKKKIGPYLQGLTHCRELTCNHTDLNTWLEQEKMELARDLEYIALDCGCLELKIIYVQDFKWVVDVFGNCERPWN